MKTIKNIEAQEAYYRETIASVYQSILDGKIIASVVSVSRSGMSRRIKFLRVDNDRLENVTEYIGVLSGHIKAGDKKQGNFWVCEKGLKINGCGMDMVFATLYYSLDSKDTSAWHQKWQVV
jgi:hypothetical protein